MRIIILTVFALLATSAIDRAYAQSVSISHKPWYESEVDSNKIIFNWETSAPASGEVVIGMDSLNHIFDSEVLVLGRHLREEDHL